MRRGSIITAGLVPDEYVLIEVDGSPADLDARLGEAENDPKLGGLMNVLNLPAPRPRPDVSGFT